MLLCAHGPVGVRPTRGVWGSRVTNGLPRGAWSGARSRVSRSAGRARTSCGHRGLSALWSPHATLCAGPLYRWIVPFSWVPPLSCGAVGTVRAEFRPWPSWARGPPPCPSPPCGGGGTVTGPVTLVLRPCLLVVGGTTCFLSVTASLGRHPFILLIYMSILLQIEAMIVLHSFFCGSCF